MMSRFAGYPSCHLEVDATKVEAIGILTGMNRVASVSDCTWALRVFIFAPNEAGSLLVLERMSD